MQSYASIPDSTIQVSKSDIEKLYNQRKELFKQKEGKVIKYIAVDIRPSKEDYDKASAEIESLKSELATSEKVADLVTENSEIPYMDAFFTENALDPEMKQFVKTANVGDVYGPVFENDKYRLFKLVDKTVAPDSVKVSHIMLANTGDEAAIKAKADSLLNVLKKGGDFDALAKEYSADQAAEKGGELGWFTEATALRGVNDDFKKAVFSTPVNDYSIVKSLYGTHIIKVTDKLDDAAKEAGYNLLSNVTVTANDQLLGSIKNSRPVIRWAFQNNKGDISEIFECDDKFVIAAIQGTLPEGYRSLESVTPMLKSELIAQKKGEKIAQDLSAKNLSSVDAYAQAMNSSADSVKFVSFATRRIAGIGVEPKLNAMVSLAQKDQLSAPVVGNNGVYVFKVYEQNKDAKNYDEAAEIKALDASNAYRFGFQAIQSLVNKADVEDNRIRFY